MDARELCQILDRGFIKPGMYDDWAEYLTGIDDFLCDGYRRRSMGLMCDFARDVNHVYTAVFASERVMQELLRRDAADAMLFVHHPENWDMNRAPDVFVPMDRQLLEAYRERRISIYNLHVPLDDFGPYSTSVTLARAMGMTPEQPFAPYQGALAGVFCRSGCDRLNAVCDRLTATVGHRISCYRYGSKEIAGGRVAVIAGGGMEAGAFDEIRQAGINVLVTGITCKNEFYLEEHVAAERTRTNVVGGTHYSTERFACAAMVDYFKGLGLTAEFLPDTPGLADL